MEIKRHACKLVLIMDRPAGMKGPIISEGIDHVYEICDNYLTSTNSLGSITCHLVRPIEVNIRDWREKALEWRFSQTTRRNEILELFKERALSPANRNRMARVGSW